MKIGISGTGHVAGLLGAAWHRAGHQVTLGARDPLASHPDLTVDTLDDAARGAEVVVEAGANTQTRELLSALAGALPSPAFNVHIVR